MADKDQKFAEIVEQLRGLIDSSIKAESDKLQSLADAATVLTPSDVTELIVGARRLRNNVFGSRLFGEPAWDVLLNLYIAHYGNHAIAVTSAITYGETAPTTGLRWLKILESEGLIERHGDPIDHRRSFVSLTLAGVEKLDKYIAIYTEWISTRASLRKL